MSVLRYEAPGNRFRRRSISARYLPGFVAEPSTTIPEPSQDGRLIRTGRPRSGPAAEGAGRAVEFGPAASVSVMTVVRVVDEDVVVDLLRLVMIIGRSTTSNRPPATSSQVLRLDDAA
jgi:hypothetical protein